MQEATLLYDVVIFGASVYTHEPGKQKWVSEEGSEGGSESVGKWESKWVTERGRKRWRYRTCFTSLKVNLKTISLSLFLSSSPASTTSDPLPVPALWLAAGMDGRCAPPGKHARLEVERSRRSESWEALSFRPLGGQSAPPGVALRPTSRKSQEEVF